ncbi:TonB-dependent receptor plug domain-containing protein [Bacteroides hominis]
MLSGVSPYSDVLSKTSGMQVRMSGSEGSSSRLSVRGLEGKRVGYLMDDLALNDNNESSIHKLSIQ